MDKIKNEEYIKFKIKILEYHANRDTSKLLDELDNYIANLVDNKDWVSGDHCLQDIFKLKIKKELK